MTIKMRVAGSTLTASALKVKAGGALRSARTVKVMHDDELRVVATFAPPMSLSASPTNIIGETFDNKPAAVIGNTVTITPTGGLAPFTYAWTYLSGDTATITAPTNATTAVRKVLFGETAAGSIRCTATDSLSTTATIDVAFTLEHTVT